MNKRLLVKLIKERIPTSRHSAGYIYNCDYNYILKGICLEYVPSGLYIWEFKFPLFDFFGPNLSYSRRYTQRLGFIGKDEMNENEIVEYIMSSPETVASFSPKNANALKEFIDFTVSTVTLKNHAHVRLVRAAGLILAGEKLQALKELDDLTSKPIQNKKDEANSLLLKNYLCQNEQAALSLIKDVMQKNIHILDVP